MAKAKKNNNDLSACNAQAGFVLAKGSLTSKTSGEGVIRKELIEARLVDCILSLFARKTDCVYLEKLKIGK